MSNLSMIGWAHTLVSFAALAAGFLCLPSLVMRNGREGPITIFLLLTLIAALSGFLFPGFGIGHRIGVAATIVATIGLAVRLIFASTSIGARIGAASAVICMFFLMFFTISESFRRLPPLQQLAPTLSEPPFRIAQLVNLVVFLLLAVIAAKRAGRSPD